MWKATRFQGRVFHLENERPASHDAGTSRQEVVAYKTLKNRALAGALASYNSNLCFVHSRKKYWLVEGSIESGFIFFAFRLVHLSKNGLQLDLEHGSA
jgi:hypothetical protein